MFMQAAGCTPMNGTCTFSACHSPALVGAAAQGGEVVSQGVKWYFEG